MTNCSVIVFAFYVWLMNLQEVQSMDNDWLIIVLKDGSTAKYSPEEYTDYYYDKSIFAVIKDKRWIAGYNWNCVEYFSIEYEKEDNENEIPES